MNKKFRILDDFAPYPKIYPGTSRLSLQEKTNSHTVLRFEFYVVPAAAKFGEGENTKRSSSNMRTFRTRTVEENAVIGMGKMGRKMEEGKKKRTRLFFLLLFVFQVFWAFHFARSNLGTQQKPESNHREYRNLGSKPLNSHRPNTEHQPVFLWQESSP